MENLPAYISITFLFTTLITVWLFYKATKNSALSLFIILAWLAGQAMVSVSGFYKVTNTVPPRFLILVLPPLLLIAGLFFTNKGRQYINNINAGTLTLLHVIRIPVELVLHWLYVHKTIPEVMTFEGRNFDIISGITAPVIWYFGFVKPRLHKTIVLLWNIVCLALLLNIVVIAILSAPFPFQKLGFTQPNIAILHFPFTWLPCCVVPLVLFAHLVVIRQLLVKKISMPEEQISIS